MVLYIYIYMYMYGIIYIYIYMCIYIYMVFTTEGFLEVATIESWPEWDCSTLQKTELNALYWVNTLLEP